MRWISKIKPINANGAPHRALVSALPTRRQILRNRDSPPDVVTFQGSYGTLSWPPSCHVTNEALDRNVLSLLARVVYAAPPTRIRHYGVGNAQVAGLNGSDNSPDGSPEAVLPPALQGFKLMPLLRFLETLLAADATVEEKELVTLTISSMSSSTFSEMLRCLDPIDVVGPHMDAHFGRYVSAGRAHYTQFMQVVDVYGVRGVYMLLFRCVVAAVTTRTQAGRGLLISDYKQVIRCAGATSDPVAARMAYRMMDDHGISGIRDGYLHTEFLKARFLTEPLYTQFDKMRRRVSPINLYKEKGQLGMRSPQVARLRRLRRHVVANQAHRYGQNRHKEHAELISRILRKTQPVSRLWEWHIRRGYQRDESLVCTAMIAFARTGSMAQVRHMLYRHYWIQVQDKTRKCGHTVVQDSKPMKRNNPLRPTARLCEAVVECFGCNGEIVPALSVLTHIAQRYKIRIPDQVWFDLFGWAHVRLSKPASTEWNVLQWPNKAVAKDALVHIWRIMTSEPYTVRPGWDQHDILIRYLIASDGRSLEQTLGLIMDVYPQYEAALKEVEEAAYEVALSGRPGLDRTDAMRRWSHALAKKEYMWYSVVFWCWNMTKKFKPGGPLDSYAVRLIPKLVDHFRNFFPRDITYKLATGTVTILKTDPLRRVVRDRRSILSHPALVTGDLARKPWEPLKPLKYRDVPLASFHRRRLVFRQHQANPRHNIDNETGQIRDMLAEGKLPVAQLQRHFF